MNGVNPFDVLSNLYAFEFMRMHKGTVYEDLPDRLTYEEMHEFYVRYDIYRTVHDRELKGLIELTKDLIPGMDEGYAREKKAYADYLISNNQYNPVLYEEVLRNLEGFI